LAESTFVNKPWVLATDANIDFNTSRSFVGSNLLWKQARVAWEAE
jgi:hypothetical protein